MVILIYGAQAPRLSCLVCMLYEPCTQRSRSLQEYHKQLSLGRAREAKVPSFHKAKFYVQRNANKRRAHRSTLLLHLAFGQPAAWPTNRGRFNADGCAFSALFCPDGNAEMACEVVEAHEMQVSQFLLFTSLWLAGKVILLRTQGYISLWGFYESVARLAPDQNGSKMAVFRTIELLFKLTEAVKMMDNIRDR